DTAAGDKTVTDLVGAGASVLVHEKFDASTASAQPFDRNQYDAMKLIAQAQAQSKSPGSGASPSGNNASSSSADASQSVRGGSLSPEPRASDPRREQFQDEGRVAVEQLRAELTALIHRPRPAAHYGPVLRVGFSLVCETYHRLALAPSGGGPDAVSSFI